MGRDRTNLSIAPIKCPLKIRGLETQRRDGVVWAREVMQEMVETLCEGEPADAMDILRSAVRALQDNDVDPLKLVTSKKLTQDVDAYKSLNSPHVYLVANWERTDPVTGAVIRPQASRPNVGDRVRYVILQGDDPRLFARAEDPDFARQHNLNHDVAHYLKSLDPAARLLELDFNDQAAEPIEGVKAQMRAAEAEERAKKKAARKTEEATDSLRKQGFPDIATFFTKRPRPGEPA